MAPMCTLTAADAFRAPGTAPAVYEAPIHFKDASGTWADIDPTLTATPNKRNTSCSGRSEATASRPDASP